jgi:hypothetical protein
LGYTAIASGCMSGSRRMTVQTTVDGSVFTFQGELASCVRTHHAYDALLIYDTAIRGDADRLAALEPGLRCADHPSFLCVESLRGRLDAVIKSAKRAREIARVNASFLFGFETPGTQSCSIAVRGRNPGTIQSFLPGRCSVSVRGLVTKTSQPTVIFTEEWPTEGGRTASHTWNVRLASSEHYAEVISVTQSGARPPQLSR